MTSWKFAVLAAGAIAPVAMGTTLNTKTITNAAHYGRRGNVNNTVSVFQPATAGTIRTIYADGSLTSTNVETWAKFLRVQPGGSGLASGQGYFQFSDEMNFTGSIPASAVILVPGGMSATPNLTLEHYSPDSETSVPGLDGRSTMTYTFDDALPNGGVEFSGALTNTDPTYNRLVRFLDLEPSATGTNVYYDVQPFHVAVSGRYALATAAGYDSHISLYQGSFVPSTPLVGGLEVNDEGINVLRRAGLATVDSNNDTVGISRIDWDLVAGEQYFYITSSYSNGLTGAYFNAIAGAGAVTLGIVPEPATLAMLALAGTLLVRRR